MSQISFKSEHICHRPLAETWAEFSQWENHSDWVPFTNVEEVSADGTEFTAWTGIGSSGWGRSVCLEDRMQVTSQEVGESEVHCEIVKLGPVLHGEVVIDFEQLEDGNTRITWEETLHGGRLLKVFRSPAEDVSWLALKIALNRFDRQLQRSHVAD